MTTVYFDAKGRQLACGEAPIGYKGVDEGPGLRPNHDHKIDRPKRPCCSCGRKFQPTLKRRVSCRGCFRRNTEGLIDS